MLLTARRKTIANFKGIHGSRYNSRLRTSRNSRSSVRNLSPVCLNINRIECPFEMRSQLRIIKGNKLMKRVAIAFYCALGRIAACALFIEWQWNWLDLFKRKKEPRV